MVPINTLFGIAPIVWLVTGLIAVLLLALAFWAGRAARQASRRFQTGTASPQDRAPGYLGAVLVFLLGLIGVFVVYALAVNQNADPNVAQTLVFVPLSFGLAAALIMAALIQSAQQAERRYWADRAWQSGQKEPHPANADPRQQSTDEPEPAVPLAVATTEPHTPADEMVHEPAQQADSEQFQAAARQETAALTEETWQRLQSATERIAESAAQLSQAADQIVAGSDRLGGAATQIDSDFGRYSAELTTAQSRLQEQQATLANCLSEHNNGLMRFVEASSEADQSRHEAVREQAAQAADQTRVAAEHLRQLNEQFGSAVQAFTQTSEQYVTRTLEHFDTGLAEIVNRLTRTTSEIQDAVDGLPGAIRSQQSKSGE